MDPVHFQHVSFQAEARPLDSLGFVVQQLQTTTLRREGLLPPDIACLHLVGPGGLSKDYLLQIDIPIWEIKIIILL